jgi:hypothetical protein
MSSRDAREIQAELAQQVARLQTLVDSLPKDPDNADLVSEQAVRRLLTMAVKLYVSTLEAGSHYPPFVDGNSITATDAVIAVTKILEAVDVEVFELGMWQTWGTHERS